MYIHAMVHPRGHDDDYWFGELRRSEMPRVAEILKDKPVNIEHAGPDVGKIISGVANDKGELRMNLFIDESTPAGRNAAERVRKGELRFVSYGFEVEGDKPNRDDWLKITKFHAQHLALVETPGIRGAEILAVYEVVDGQERYYIKQSMVQDKMADAPAADTLERKEIPGHLAMSPEAMALLLETVGAKNDVTTQEELVALLLKVKEANAAKAKAEADAKKAEEDKFIEDLTQKMLDPNVREFTIEAHKNGLVHDPEATMNAALLTPQAQPVMQLYASACTKYGDAVKKLGTIEKINAELVARNALLEGKQKETAKAPPAEVVYKPSAFRGAFAPQADVKMQVTTAPVAQQATLFASAGEAQAAPMQPQLGRKVRTSLSYDMINPYTDGSMSKKARV